MKVKLNNTEVYNFSKPYIIAEIGSNHNGDMELAKEHILSAKSCGCDCVKFQSWTNESLISKIEFEKDKNYNSGSADSLKQQVEQYYLRREQHFELKEFCVENNIEFISTPFSESEADMLEELNVPFYKIASMDINNVDLLRHVAKKNKPVLLSTGMASIEEIERAVSVIEEHNNQIVILHCIAVYPPKLEDINLNNIKMLQNLFEYPIGFSDHSIGTTIPLASAVLGSCVIEKHFTLDKNLPGWDHAVSANPEEMKFIVEESSKIQTLLGSYRRIVSDDEQDKKLRFRRSVVTVKELKAGHEISREDFTYKRPGTGIKPDEVKYILGRKLNRDITNDELINWEDLN
jgi:N-acetylneuraminate synthase